MCGAWENTHRPNIGPGVQSATTKSDIARHGDENAYVPSPLQVWGTSRRVNEKKKPPAWTGVQLLWAAIVSPTYRRGNHNRTLMCHDQRCYNTYRQTFNLKSYHPIFTNEMSTVYWLDAVCTSRPAAHSPEYRIPLEVSLHWHWVIWTMIEMLCLGLRVMHISPHTWNITHYI